VRVPKRRYRCQHCHASLTAFADASLDESGLTPLVLERSEHLACLLPYQASSLILREWGVETSSSALARASFALEQLEQERSQTRLIELSTRPLVLGQPTSRVWMLEVDGVIVPTRAEGHPGPVDWREVKTAVLYRLNTPSERYQVSVLKDSIAFEPLVHGLLRHAGVTQNDVLVGLSDGASWIANLFGDVGVHRHILDVFHASAYLEVVMTGLGWTEAQRCEERRKLCRGELDIQTWLNWWVTPTTRGKLDQEALKALAYLERQAIFEHTAYPKFKAEGLVVIGSGEIEGANKSVIGARLKVSGAQWGVAGADGKAFARGMLFSKRRVVGFDQVRHAAFPRAA
jgi:hypothetical protein